MQQEKLRSTLVFKSMKKICLTIAIVLLTTSFSTGWSAQKDTLYTVAMCGDIMLGTTYPVVQLPANEGKNLFDACRHIFKSADLSLGNLEGVFLEGGKSRKGTGRYAYSFRMPTAWGPRLKEAGFHYMNLANNHTKDFYDEGIYSTEKVLDRIGIKYSGVEGRADSAVIERSGVKWGICSFGHNAYTLKTWDTTTVKRIITNLRDSAKADLIIVFFHGGAEGVAKRHLPQGMETFLGENRGDLRKFARFCIDLGADIVAGSGPHVVRGCELYKNRMVIYSMGNFCTPYGINVAGKTGYAPVFEVKIKKDGTFVKGKIHSFIQQKGIGPVKDEANIVAAEIATLTREDMKNNGALKIDKEGNITPYLQR